MKKFLAAAIVLFLAAFGALYFYKEADDEREHAVPRIGLIVTGSKTEDGWSASHYDALAGLAEEMRFELSVRENVSEFDDSCLPVIAELYAEGVRIFCVAGMNFGDKLARVSGKYGDAYFLHASGTERGRNVSSFFGKMYQARYLSGIVAGLRSETGRLGFVAAMEVSEVVRGINAFTLGVRSVRPGATVYVRYSGLWDAPEAEREAAGRLLDRHGVDVLTYHQNRPTAAVVADERGVYSVMYHVGNGGELSDRCLTAAVWRWGRFYRERIEDILYSRFASRSYWVGLEKGIIGLAELSDRVAEGTADRVGEAERRILSGGWDVFYGPIRDNAGGIRVEAGSAMSDDNLINHFDWYVEGVVVDRL